MLSISTYQNQAILPSERNPSVLPQSPDDSRNQYTFLPNQPNRDVLIDIHSIDGKGENKADGKGENKNEEPELCWCCCERQPEEMKFLAFQKTCECAIQPACRECQERLERCPICRRGIQPSNHVTLSAQYNIIQATATFVKIILFIVIFARQETKEYNHSDIFYIVVSGISTLLAICNFDVRTRERPEHVLYGMLFSSIRGIAGCIAFWSMIDMGGASEALVIVDLISLLYREMLLIIMVTGISIQLRQQ